MKILNILIAIAILFFIASCGDNGNIYEHNPDPNNGHMGSWNSSSSWFLYAIFFG
jgi:predicted small lipoprotein YifL